MENSNPTIRTRCLFTNQHQRIKSLHQCTLAHPQPTINQGKNIIRQRHLYITNLPQLTNQHLLTIHLKNTNPRQTIILIPILHPIINQNMKKLQPTVPT